MIYQYRIAYKSFVLWNIKGFCIDYIFFYISLFENIDINKNLKTLKNEFNYMKILELK